MDVSLLSGARRDGRMGWREKGLGSADRRRERKHELGGLPSVDGSMPEGYGTFGRTPPSSRTTDQRGEQRISMRSRLSRLRLRARRLLVSRRRHHHGPRDTLDVIMIVKVPKHGAGRFALYGVTASMASIKRPLACIVSG
ncbi:uncharacterized protein PFL1_06563 [Pseudozyma flocculosa PF-1]|uniref:Uncharacterized protein n=1 Tax=Pseudozyma flocculosa PF-1 TaxID=1277687 RepID=A0A061H1A9_9BASI|nr:uncharacterized protein PFL1_06563 [Pseudozyma flocculosa PF-1]EPQ25889.1 hypothetical protein PFL1_06563 [Pseudozyma flocculosa PF-1]